MKNKAIGKDVVKSNNFYEILYLLHRNAPMSRKDIAKSIGLTPSAVTKLTNELINFGIIVEGEKIKSKRSGRKEIEIDINSNFGYVLGINIEKTEIIISLSTFNCLKIWAVVWEVPPLTENILPESFSQLIYKIVLENCLKHNIKIELIRCVGISCVGLVDPRGGICENSFNLFPQNTNVLTYIKQKFNVPVYIENNVRALSVLEMHLRGFRENDKNKTENGLFLKHGPGFGGAIIINNVPFPGSLNRSGEIGHIKVENNNETCFCGRVGCISNIIGRTSIVKQALSFLDEQNTKHLFQLHKQFGENIDINMVLVSAKMGDIPTIRVLENVALTMATAIDNAMMLFDGQVVICYGELLNDDWFFNILNYCLDLTSSSNRKYKLTKSLIFEQWQASAIIALKNFYKYLSENIE